MRKIVAIFLVLLLIYNMIGHYLVLIYQQQVARLHFSQTLENDQIPDDDLFIIKIPASLYVPAKNTDFEPITGSFEHKGKFYDMVKRKVQNDTLYIYCANNHKKQFLASQLADYVKSYVVDFESGKNKNESNKLLKSFAKEYLATAVFSFSIFYKYTNSENNVNVSISFPAMPLISIPSPPPEA
ncbi:MAG: hypothetical protein MUE81_17995 [Thermoflexibacter sp.]|nr:hypothetical protein [Thermoflexibacter sp.]